MTIPCMGPKFRVFLAICVIAGFILPFLYISSNSKSSDNADSYNQIIHLFDSTNEFQFKQETYPPDTLPKKGSDFFVDTKTLLAHIHRRCAVQGIKAEWVSDNLTKKDLPSNVMIAVPKYDILYVSNPKTGSTSFKKFVLRLQGDERPYEEMEHVHRNGKNYENLKYLDTEVYKNLTVKEIVTDKVYVVGFIRNPITRLISGFRNKILRTEGGWFNKLVNQYSSPNATDIEKFKVFAKLVTTSQITDHHFAPQWNAMRVCTMPYNLLGQTEVTHESIDVLMRETGITGVDFPGSRTEEGKDDRSSVEEVSEFINPLPQSIIKEIYKFYRWDFDLLGYAKLENPNFPYIDLSQFKSN